MKFLVCNLMVLQLVFANFALATTGTTTTEVTKTTTTHEAGNIVQGVLVGTTEAHAEEGAEVVGESGEKTLDWAESFITDFLKDYDWGAWVLFALSILGMMLSLATAVVAATPSKKDDDWLEKMKKNVFLGWLFSFLSRFSLLHSKR